MTAKQANKKRATATRRRRGYYVWVTVRYRTYWRTGSGTKVTAERLESHRKWVSLKEVR